MRHLLLLVAMAAAGDRNYRIDWLRPDLYLWPTEGNYNLGTTSHAWGEEGFHNIYIAAPRSSVVILGYHTGMRRGELLALRWQQVDWSASLIRLDASQTKAKRARAVPIYGEMREALEQLGAGVFSNGINSLPLRMPKSGATHIFTRDGKPIRDFRESWANACAAAGLPGLLFHDLRRSAVRNMERAGIPRSVAMAISGHSTESVYKRYDIVSEDDLHEAGRKLESRNKK